MTIARMTAIAFIYGAAAFAWFILGMSVHERSGEFDARLSQEVARLWGGRHSQAAPQLWVERPRQATENIERTTPEGRKITDVVTREVIDRIPVAVAATRIDVALRLDHQKKGLLWYDTYGVSVRATYRARNPDAAARTMGTHLSFASEQAQFDNFAFRINGQNAETAEDLSKGSMAHADVPPGGEVLIDLAYDSRGLDTWTYALASSGAIAQVRDFVLTMRTDFDRIDFPPGAMSPTERRRTETGWELTWRFDSLLTGQQIAMDLPNRLNPGPLAARITFFAPVSLLFFLTVLVILGVLREQSLHPMNYAFLSAAFFAFHLLLAYLVDHVSVHLSFAIASATSVLLVVSYLRIVAGSAFALLRAGLAQLIFLVLFSYSFFFEGYTGLTVTIGAIVTLFVLMQITARVDWARVFSRQAVAPGRSS
jgi:hypothetical protein